MTIKAEDKMNVSVVMTTYNGEKYLVEQLDSLRKQSFAVNEVLFFDDRSIDSTQDIIEKYIETYKLSEWKFTRNVTNLGWRRNFIYAFEKASGDIIFPCDQDDIWHHDKIENMVKIMETHPEINLLASNYNIFRVDGNMDNMRYYLDDETLEKVNLSFHNIYNARPGCVYCFRKNHFMKYKSLWNEVLGHDDFLWKISLLDGSLYIFNKCTIEYRRHSTNTTQLIHSKANRIKENNSYKQLFEACQHYSLSKSNTVKRFLKKEIRFCNIRKRILEDSSLMALLCAVPMYKLYKTRRHFLGDIAIILRPSLFEE